MTHLRIWLGFFLLAGCGSFCPDNVKTIQDQTDFYCIDITIPIP